MFKLCVIPGDGIGHEVVPAAVRLLEHLVPGLEVVEAQAGWSCFCLHGEAVPAATLGALRECGAGLFGAVSSPTRKVEGYRSAILSLRQSLGLNVNLRPIRSWPAISPKPGIDLLILRENSEGMYVGIERMVSQDQAIAEAHVSRAASRALALRAAEIATLRRARRVTLVHKANVLPLTCGLFRETCREVLADSDLGDIVDERLVDIAALELVQKPEAFDLVVTTNLFGDILSDLASHWGGGLGMAPSLNWGEGLALAEPVHGSAPDIAGTGRANPIAALLSCALLLRYHWGAKGEADRLEQAVEAFLTEAGTADFGMQTTVTIERGVLAQLKRQKTAS